MTALMNWLCADQHHGRAYWTIAVCIIAAGFPSADAALSHLTAEAEANGFTVCPERDGGNIDVFTYKAGTSASKPWTEIRTALTAIREGRE